MKVSILFHYAVYGTVAGIVSFLFNCEVHTRCPVVVIFRCAAEYIFNLDRKKIRRPELFDTFKPSVISGFAYAQYLAALGYQPLSPALLYKSINLAFGFISSNLER